MSVELMVAQEETRNAKVEAARLRAEVEALRAAADAPPYVDCICPGCPRRAPQAWASGMCEPCCAEDCEHTDGARAMTAERDRLDAENTRLVHEAIETDGQLCRLRAVLANTMENRAAVLNGWEDDNADGVLAFLRVRAGIE